MELILSAEKRKERLVRQYESCRITKEELRRLLEKGVLGRVTGIVGPFVLRYQSGKLVISERALFYAPTTSTVCIEGRKNFGSTVKFAQLLNSIDEIKTVWSRTEIKAANAWNRIIKYNNISGEYPSLSNLITPPDYHFTQDIVCRLSEEYRIEVSGSYQLEENDRIHIIIAAYDPVNKENCSFEMLEIKGAAASPEQITKLKKYKKYIIYSAVIRSEGTHIFWSNTAAGEGSIPVEKAECSEEMVLEWLLIAEDYLLSTRREKTERSVFHPPPV